MNLKKRNTLRKFLKMYEAYIVSYKRGTSDEDFCCRQCWEKRKEDFLEPVICRSHDIYIHGSEFGYAVGDEWKELEYPRLCSCFGGF